MPADCVSIVAAGHSRFGRLEGTTLEDLIVQVTREALSDAELLQSKRVDTHDAASLDSLIERIRHYLPGL